MAMTLEQQAGLLGRIEAKMIAREGRFTTKTPYRQGRRYFANERDAAFMRGLYASWLVRAIQQRENKAFRRRTGFASPEQQRLASGYNVHAG